MYYNNFICFICFIYITRFGCCPDGKKEAQGPSYLGCFECEGSGECESCNDTKFGCCPDSDRPASGENFEGCDIEGEFHIEIL